MSKYRIREDAAEIWGNKGGGGIEKTKLFADSKFLKSQFQTILSDVNALIKNQFNFYICIFKYAKIPAKKWRIDFGQKPQNLNDIKQKGVYTYIENDNHFTNLFYKLNESDVNWIKDKINEILSAKKVDDISNETYKSFLDKIIEKSSTRNNNIPQLRVKRILQNVPIESFTNIRIVRILPIAEVINYLKEQNILTSQNFDDQLFIAYLTFTELNRIIGMGLNIFYSISEVPEFQLEETNFDDIIAPVQITGTPSRTIIGVIDSGNELSGDFERYIVDKQDHRELGLFHENTHGSSVASLIIANDQLNPTAPDGLGNFNIKHFELLEPMNDTLNREGKAGANFFHIMRKIPEIVRSNPDIKVWNLSFGAVKKPYSRMISDQGKLLDQLSKELNVIFVIAAGNERLEHGMYSLNSPGDSLNSLTVGSSKIHNENVTYSEYSSIGPILHFEKPEVSHFGGPNNNDESPMVTYSPGFTTGMCGTSFAAPRVSRMVASYISEGLTPSEAKAKVLSMAVSETPSKRASAFGHIGSLSPKIELSLGITLDSKEPRYIPIKIPSNASEIKISLVNQVDPMPAFGEEYSIQNFEGHVVVYDSSVKNPENEYVGLLSKNVNSIQNEYASETFLRFESGKYFNSSVYVTTINNVQEVRQKLLDKGCDERNIKTAIRIKKLDLFETIDRQIASVSMIASIYGDNLDVEQFENENESILMIDIEADV